MANVTLLPESQQLDRYQLIGEIASGGMASVFLGRLAGVGGFQRLVAIKRLHPHLAREQEFVEMFLDEARLAASIHHRNVVPILEIGTTPAGYYLVMEYIEGVTLARLMTQSAALREPVPRPVLLRLVVDTLSGLHAAHELTDDANEPLHVVHRDCSPQNILIGLDGCTRITDFGIARASSRLHSTREGAMKGKLAYMAPEQTQGDEFDRRADLWSVAVVLWEVLALRRLFKSKTEAQTLKRLLHDPIPRLTDVDASISPALASVCQMALERDPEHRFQTAAEFADALESAAKVAARPDTEPVATERTVESLMKQRYGGDVDAQREELRSFLQATPTMVGPRIGPPRTDPGWIGPTASDPGVAFRQSNTWERVPAEEPTRGASPLAHANSSMPPSQPGMLQTGPALPGAPHPGHSHPGAAPTEPGTKRSWPAAPLIDLDDPNDTELEDETHIYDPTSTTGVTADPEPEKTDWVPQPEPETHRSAGLPLVREKRTPWPILAALLAGTIGVAAFVAYRSGAIPAFAGETAAPTGEGEKRSRPAARPAPDPVASAPEPATVTPSATASASAPPPRPNARVYPPYRPGPRPTPRPDPTPDPAPVDKPDPVPVPKPDPKPDPKPVPKPPPKPGGGDLDDLSNPYR